MGAAAAALFQCGQANNAWKPGTLTYLYLNKNAIETWRVGSGQYVSYVGGESLSGAVGLPVNHWQAGWEQAWTYPSAGALGWGVLRPTDTHFLFALFCFLFCNEQVLWYTWVFTQNQFSVGKRKLWFLKFVKQHKRETFMHWGENTCAVDATIKNVQLYWWIAGLGAGLCIVCSRTSLQV